MHISIPIIQSRPEPEPIETPRMSDYSDIVKELKEQLLWEENELDIAVKNALKADIPELQKYGITSGKGFLDFADWMVRGWIPTESTQGRDIYYILCVFYFVLSQEPLGPRLTKIDPKSVNKGLRPLSDWTVRFAKEIGKQMDQPSSWNEASLTSFRNSPLFRVWEAEDPKEWKCFNDFFHRKLRQGRKIAGGEDDHIVTFPADSTFAGAYQITDQSEVVLKNLPWKVEDLLGKYGKEEVLGTDKKYGQLFNEGLWTHVFLNVFDYHRQHAPVAGEIEVFDVIQGAAYLEVLVKKDEQVGHNFLQPCRRLREPEKDTGGVVTLEAPNSPGYQFLQTRGIIIIKTKNMGRVAVLPIGMATVSSVILNKELKKGSHVKKGDEISHFAFGGSDCVILFEEKARVSGFPDSNPTTGQHFYYGEKLCKSYYKSAGQ